MIIEFVASICPLHFEAAYQFFYPIGLYDNILVNVNALTYSIYYSQ